MNGFLVLARCLIDDIPLAVFGSIKEAKEFKAEFCEIDNCGNDRVFESALDRIRSKEFEEAACNDISEVICIDICEFRNGRFNFDSNADPI